MRPAQSLHLSTTSAPPAEGTRRIFDRVERVYYSGHWIKTYPVPADTLRAKKELIEALTRRLFNHTEHGLNVPGVRLAEARAAYDAESDPARRRVKGAMLAGALFNRANDIFRRLVDLQADGVEISSEYPLLQECALLDVGDVHIFEADVAAIIGAQDRNDLANGRLFKAERSADVNRPVEIGADEAMIFGRQIGGQLTLA